MKYRYLRFPSGKDKAVTFSYDDGVRDDIRLAETLTRHGIKGTFNINSVRFTQQDPAKFLTADEVKAVILSAGHEIAVHGKNHRAPGACRPIELIHEVLECRKELEALFGGIIRGMAYPDAGIRRFHTGLTYTDVKRQLMELDIAYARTLGGDNDSFLLPEDWHAWMPTAHHSNPDALSYAKKFIDINVNRQYGGNRHPRLYYLWGHSYEFSRDGNWELLETLCQTLGGYEDVWYATNMEIYDYVYAYRTLVYSADGCIVHNPTLKEIWFDASGVLYHILPGETLRIVD